MKSSRTLTEDVLVAGLDDWTDPGWVLGLVGTHYPEMSSKDRLSLSIGLIAEMVNMEWIVPGSVNGGFRAWEKSNESWIERIVHEWLLLDRNTTPGEICWFDLTEAGTRMAQEIWSRTEGE